LETGYAARNEWLEWMMYTARQNNQFNCIACAKARPYLGTVPFNLSNHSDPIGLQCVLQLHNESFVPNTKQCKNLSLLFPAVKKRDVPPSALAYKGNYTCVALLTLGFIRYLVHENKQINKFKKLVYR